MFNELVATIFDLCFCSSEHQAAIRFNSTRLFPCNRWMRYFNFADSQWGLPRRAVVSAPDPLPGGPDWRLGVGRLNWYQLQRGLKLYSVILERRRVVSLAIGRRHRTPSPFKPVVCHCRRTALKIPYSIAYDQALTWFSSIELHWSWFIVTASHIYFFFSVVSVTIVLQSTFLLIHKFWRMICPPALNFYLR